MQISKVINGVYWVEIPEVDLYILCGSPENVIKYLIKDEYIKKVKKDNINYETGPNAILLSELSIQNGCFSNLAEFPVLHMLYKQGMIIPGHPNNKGIKPILIGTNKQIMAQSQYIYFGNYGLTSIDELMDCGLSQKEAEEIIRMKLKFAYGKIKIIEELLDVRIIKDKKIEIRDNVFIERIDINKYEISYKDEKVLVDLNLRKNEKYYSPYALPYTYIKESDFSVIHIGEGDGWDPYRPCMGSVLYYKGDIYIIDAGPNIIRSLISIGVSINDIKGIFHTHGHDDHFAGLTYFLSSGFKIKYYASRPVIKSVANKLMSLLLKNEKEFGDYFDICELKLNSWNDIYGLEVYPFLSPHPLETNIFIFRVKNNNGYKSYAHFGDIAGINILKSMITDNSEMPGISREYYDKVIEFYKTPANIKKIDVGGGLIHGNTEDFRNDKSEIIYLSHTSSIDDLKNIDFGKCANFGEQNILIPASYNYYRDKAINVIENNYGNNLIDLDNLINSSQFELLDKDYLIINNQKNINYIYIILSGIIEVFYTESNNKFYYSIGYIAGEYEVLVKNSPHIISKTTCYVNSLKIPKDIFINFINKNKLSDKIIQNNKLKEFIIAYLFSIERIPNLLINKICGSIILKEYPKGFNLNDEKENYLFILKEGGIKIYRNEDIIEEGFIGNIYGEEKILCGKYDKLKCILEKDSRFYCIPKDIIIDKPAILWELQEIYNKRIYII